MSNKIVAEDFIIKKNNKDFKKAVIERQNLTNEFTIAEVEADEENLARLKREMTGQVRVSSAVLANITRNHEFVASMSDEQLRTAAYVYETKKVLEAAERKLKEIKVAEKKYKEVKDVVYKKFGFVESNVL